MQTQKQSLSKQIATLEKTARETPEPQKPQSDGSQEKLAQLNSLKAQRAEAEKRLAIKQKQNSSSKTKLWVMFGFSIVCAVLALVFGVTGQATYLTATIGAVAGVLLILWAILFAKLKKEGGEETSKLKGDLENLNVQISHVEQQIILIAASAEKHINALSQQAQQDKDLAVAKIRLSQIERQIEMLVEEIEEQDAAITSMQIAKQENSQKQEIIKSALEFLEQAKNNISTRFVEPMQQKFDDFLRKLEEKGQIKLDSDLNVFLDTQSGVREDKYLSRGKRDLVTICKRFALIESVFQKQKPFVILDDPFVNLDEKSLKNMLSLVEQFAKQYQVIYLICHHSRAK